MGAEKNFPPQATHTSHIHMPNQSGAADNKTGRIQPPRKCNLKELQLAQNNGFNFFIDNNNLR